MKRHKLLLLCLVVLSMLGMILVGCGDDEQPSAPQPGPESGVYYCDTADGEYTLSLSNGNQVTLTALGSLITGTYTLNGEQLQMTLGSSSIAAQYVNETISMSYMGVDLTLIRKTEYTVTFDVKGGSSIPDVTAINGRSIDRPSVSPKKAGYGFAGWYTDSACTTRFVFGVTPITGDTTLYALWLAPSDSEYTVKFDLGYAASDDEAISATTTVANRVTELATPTRSGYTFKGWWLSLYDDAERLSYPVTEETVIEYDVTLYAMWQNNSNAEKPLIYVENNRITWDKTDASATLKIEGPEGYGTNGVTENVFGITAAASLNVDFASAPEGDYVITLTSGNVSNVVYYKNKGLKPVGNFSVRDNSVLLFDAVEHADNYIITVECGDPTHNHSAANGDETAYDFSSCEMREGGILFTVRAEGNGYAPSVTREYVHEANLGAVSGYAIDSDTGILTWNALENATGYIVKVNGEVVGETNGANATRYDVRSYVGESVTVTVGGKAHGYNTTYGASYSYENSLAAPTGVGLENEQVKWNAVAGATSYTVTINGITKTVTGTVIDLSEFDIEWELDASYSIVVRAVNGDKKSFIGDDVSVSYSTKVGNLRYQGGALAWDAVLGAASYEIKVNEGEAVTLPSTTTRVSVKLTDTHNVLSVRMYDASGTASEWTAIEVDANRLSFDVSDGTAIPDLYLVSGDPIALPTTALRPGYNFNEWYTSADGAERFTQSTFSGSEDITVYAHWLPKTYTVKLNYGAYGSGTQETQDIVYATEYTLPVPTITDARRVFLGWSATSDGNGTMYTDYAGVSIGVYGNSLDDVTLYAFYLEALQYDEDGEGYAVSKGRYFSRVENLTIPSEFNGKTVVSLNEYAFQNSANLKYVSIPDTVKTIPDTAFNSCNNIIKYNVYATGEREPVYFSDDSGILAFNNPITGYTEVAFVPPTFTGVYTLPDRITRLGSNSFRRSLLTEIRIPASVVEIASDAFVNCPNLTTITFLPAANGQEEAPLRMSADAINSDCKKLVVLNLPARLRDFGLSLPEVFSKYTALKEINITGDNNVAYASDRGIVLSADKSTILYSPAASEVDVYVIPDYVVSVGANAFENSKSLKSLTVHSGVISIGERSFYNCDYLEEVIFKAATLPSSLSIGKEAFAGCAKIASLVMEEEGELKAIASGGKTLYVYEYTKSCGITSIGESAFANAPLTSVTLPSTLRSLGKNAFANNTKLVTLDLSHVSSQLVFGDGVFSGCSALKSINLTDNVGVIEFRSVFNGSGVKNFNVSPTNPNYSSDENGVLYNADQTAIVYYPDGLDIEYTIPSTVTRIGSGVFDGATNLTSIVISAGVKEIGVNAFLNCANLESVTFEAGGIEPLVIGDTAFKGCTKLTSILLPERTISIGVSAFTNLNLTSVTLNEGLKQIGDNAFYTIKTLESITIPSTVTYIGKNAFYGYSGQSVLSEVTFATSEGEAQPLTMGTSVFQYNTALTSITLPERLQYVPESAFANCSNLESVVIPSTVGNTDGLRGIGIKAFDSCVELNSITFTTGGTRELSFATGAFNNCPKLTVLNLPNRISGMATSYDVFEVDKYGGNLTFVSTTTYAANTIATSTTIGIAEFNVEAGGSHFASYEGIIYTAGLTEVVQCPARKVGVVQISKNARTIIMGAFAGCNLITAVEFEDSDNAELTDFELPDNGTSYGSNFYGCNSLETITFPVRLTELGDNALYRNTGFTNLSSAHSLNTITFAEGCKLTSIGKNAFDKTLVTEIELPGLVTSVDTAPFSDYKGGSIEVTITSAMNSESIANILANATSVKFSGNASVNVEDGFYYAMEDGKKVLVYCEKDPAAFEAAPLVIPADVAKIAPSAFNGIKRFSELSFAAPAEGEEEIELAIGDNAFYNSGITKVTLPKRLTSLGEQVFRGSTALASVEFEEGYSYATITKYMFYGCTALTEIDIPDCVTTIAAYAFQSCSKLASVTFGDESNLVTIGASAFKSCVFTEIAIPAKVANLTDMVTGSAFASNTKLTTVTFKGNFVLTIAPNTFEGCTALTTITLPNSVKTIGGSAFKGCTALVNFTVPANVTTIGDSAFSGATKLANFSFAEGSIIASIGKQAFYNNNGITSLTLPDSLTELGTGASAGAFQNMKALTTVTFGKNSNLTLISAYAFSGCSALESIVLPGMLEEIGGSAFGSGTNACKALTNIDFNGNTTYLTTIGDYGFNNSAISSITLPDSVIYMGRWMFQNCTNLTSFTIPSAMTEIPYGAFNGATSLKKVTLHSNVTIIDSTSFKNCSALEDINIDVCTNLTKIGAHAFYKCVALKEIDVTMSATGTENWIYNEAFYGCTELKTVTLSNVHAFGCGVFNGCAKLSSVTLPSTLVDLSSQDAFYKVNNAYSEGKAFYGCKALTSISLPAGITYIPKYTFQDCTALSSVTFYGIQSLGADAFKGCTSLTSATMLGSDPNASLIDGALYANGVLVKYFGNGTSLTVAEGTTKINDYAFQDNATLKTVTLPESLTVLGTYAFSGCTALTTINLNNVVTVGNYAFTGCTKLTGNVSFGTGATIGTQAFKGCSSITSLDLSGVSTIAGNAFENCTSLITVTVPSSVKITSSGTFTGCTSLKSATLNTTQFTTSSGNGMFKNCTSLTGVTFAEGTTQIGQSMFEGCTSLTYIALPDTVTATGLGTTAFKNCTSLVEVHLPVGLTSIPNNTFLGCSALTTVNIPDGVTTIGQYAFQNCTSLTSVVIPAKVTKIDSYAFQNCTGISSIVIGSKVATINTTAFGGWTADQTVYTSFASKPSGWNASWMGSGGKVTVVWGCTLDADASYVISFTKTSATADLADPVREGYTFGGWIDEDGNVYASEQLSEVEDGTELTAVWTANDPTD